MPPTIPCIKPDWPAPANVFALCTIREGGLSRAPYRSLNLAHHVGDDAARVARNRQLLSSALPHAAGIQWLSQVHGARVVQAGDCSEHPRADAAWSREIGLACAVLTADCLPVLFCSASGDRVAAAHAGWRGLLEGVLEGTVASLAADPGQLLAWLGPAIGPGAFEVGPEVRAAFLAGSPPGGGTLTSTCFVANQDNPGHYFADLYALARLRLRAAGVSRLFGGGLCTVADSGRFFSFRRDGRTGRMVSLVLRSA